MSHQTYQGTKFFVFRVGLLKSNQRILEFTPTSLLEYDLHGALKERIDYSQIVEVSPKKKEKKDFLIKTLTYSIVYQCYVREQVLSAYWEHKDAFSSFLGSSFDVSKLSSIGEAQSGVIVIKNATIQRMNPTTGDAKFPKLITEIQQLYLHQEQGQISIEFKHPSTHRYLMESCTKFLAALQAVTQENYGFQLPVIECPAPKFAVEAADVGEIHDCPRKYYFDVKVLKYGSGGTKERNILLTSEFLYTQHPKSKVISSGRKMSTLTDLVLYPDKGVVGLVYQGKYLQKLYIEGEQTGVFFANLMHLARKNGNPYLEISFYEVSRGMRIEPYPRPSDFKHEEYFSVKRSYFVDQSGVSSVPKDHRDKLLQDLREFNSNFTLLPSDVLQISIMPAASGPTVNSKKWIYWLIEWINTLEADDANVTGENAESYLHSSEQQLIMEIIRFGQRCLGSATAMLTMTSSSLLEETPEIKTVLIALLRSQNQFIVYYAASFVKYTLTQPRTKVLTPLLGNKSSLVDSSLVEEIFSLLGKNGKYHSNMLAAHTLIESLDVCLISHSASTDPRLLQTMTTTVSRNVRTMYDLIRSPCLAISDYATVLLHFVFGSAKNTFIRQLQEECLSRCVLVWLIKQALSLPTSQHQEASANLVGLIVGDNPDCLLLVAKVFPPTLLQKSPLKKSIGEFDWKEVFVTFRQDYLLPDLIWNGRTRLEICDYIVSQCNAFHAETSLNPDHRYVWNFEEFRVNYIRLENEIMAGKFYISTILNLMPNCKVEEPDALVSALLYKILLSPADVVVQVSCLKVLTWCYSKYSSRITWESQQMEAVISLLQREKQEIVDQSLLLLQELFIVSGNIQEFVKLNGVSCLTFLLTTIFGAGQATNPALTVVSRTEICLTLLQQCVSVVNHVVSRLYPPIVKFPMPTAKSQLSRYPNIFRVVQVLAYASVSSDPSSDTQQLLVSHSLTLIENLLTHNDELACEIYKTGLFYFLLTYGGNDEECIESICALLHRLHLQLKDLNKPDPLKDLLPPSFIDVLEKQGAGQLAKIFRSKNYIAPNLVWTGAMRDYCRNQIMKHIAPFLNLLLQGVSATYQYTPMAPISYTTFTMSFLQCGGYYVDALLDAKSFPNFEIPNPYSLFAEACPLLARVSQLSHKISTMKLMLMLFNKYPQLAKQPLGEVFDSFDRWIKEMSQPQVLGDEIIRLADRLFQSHLSFRPVRLRLLEHELLLSLMNEVTDLSLSSSSHNLELFLIRNGVAGVSLCLHFLLNLAKLPSSKAKMDTVFANVHTTLNIIHRVVSAALERVTLEYITIRSILRCIDPSFPSSLSLVGMQIVEKLSASLEFQEMLFQCGVHFYLLSVILQPIITFAKPSTHDPLANYAWTTLAHIAGVLPKFPSIPAVSATLSKILTPVIFAELVKVESAPEKSGFISILRKTHRSPDSIWTPSTAKELSSFSIAWCTDKAESQFADNQIPLYTDHLSELQVSDVFASVLTVFPKWKPPNPLNFVEQVIAAIDYILHTQVLPLLPSLPLSTPLPLPPPVRLHQPKNSKPLANISVLLECISLLYANNLLSTKKQIDETICASASLFLIVAEVSGENDGLRQAALQLLLSISTEPTFASVVSEKHTMQRLCLHMNAPNHLVRLCILKIVNNAITNSVQFEQAVMASGMILFLLTFLLESSETKDPKRELSASILKKIVSQHDDYSAYIISVLSRILPPYLVKHVTLINEFLQFFDQTHETPELIWNSSMKHLALVQLHALLQSIVPRLQEEAIWPMWPIDTFHVPYPDWNHVPKFAGVYIRVFNQSPKLPTNALYFFSELLSAITDLLFSNKSAEITEFSLEELVEALYHLVVLQPSIVSNSEIPLLELLKFYLTYPATPPSPHPLTFVSTICKLYAVYCDLSTDVIHLLLKVLQSSIKESHSDALDALSIYIKKHLSPLDGMSEWITDLMGCLITLLGSNPEEVKKNRILDILFTLMQNKRDLVIQNLMLRQDILSVLRKWDPKQAPPLPSAMQSRPSFLLHSNDPAPSGQVPDPIPNPTAGPTTRPTSGPASSYSTSSPPPDGLEAGLRLSDTSLPPSPFRLHRFFSIPPPPVDLVIPSPIDSFVDLPPPPPLARSLSLPHLQEALFSSGTPDPPPPLPAISEVPHDVPSVVRPSNPPNQRARSFLSSIEQGVQLRKSSLSNNHNSKPATTGTSSSHLSDILASAMAKRRLAMDKKEVAADGDSDDEGTVNEEEQWS